MEPFPHHYLAEAGITSDSATVTLRAPELPPLETAAPREFGGSGEHWSPETLLVGAVADCFVLSFKAVAAASKFDWRALEVSVDGTLDRIDRRMRFTTFEIRAKVTVPAASERMAMRILEKSEEACLVTNSLSAEIRFEGEVRVEG
jgi:organic hydroperoxide reductase OsmC/OhrA